MNMDYRHDWRIQEKPPRGSFDEKQPYVENGTDVPSPERYHDPDYARAEWDRMWTKTWLLAGPVADVPEPGDYFRYDVGPESFIIVRGDDGVIRAHYNVCPHRGSRIVLGKVGSVAKFSCPFHSWTFNLDGSIDEVRDRETFREQVLCNKHDLTSVRCETVAGLIFITMNNEAAPVRSWLGKVADHLELYEMEAMKVIHHKRSEWAANWKVGIDAFAEVYHLASVHPQTQGVMDDYHAQIDVFPNGFTRHMLGFAKPSKRFSDQKGLNDGVKMMLRDVGIDPDSFEGTVQDAREAIYTAKRARAKGFGLDYSRFTDSQIVDSIAYHIFPNVHLGLHPEAVYIMSFLPHPSDPRRFYYDNVVLYRHVDHPNYKTPAWMGLPKDMDTNPQTRPEMVAVPFGTPPQLGEVLDQDSELLPHVQEGVMSRAFRGPLWCEQEMRVRHFHKELDRYMARQK